MTRHLLTLIAFIGVTPRIAFAAPCTSATAVCTEWITLGTARSLVYRTYALDARNDAITRVLVMVHGAGRDADNGGTLTSAGGSVPG